MLDWVRFKDRFRHSLWLLPALMSGGALCVGVFLLWLTHRYPLRHVALLRLDALSEMANTLLAAMVTILGITLPLTFGILLRASSQFSPMVLRSYRTAWQPKLFIGGLIATTFYLMLVNLGANVLDLAYFPTPALIVGYLFVSASVLSIPLFFHYFIASIEPSYLVASITRDLLTLLHQYEEVAQGELEGLTGRQDRSFLDHYEGSPSVCAQESGYLQSIDYSALLADGFESGAIPVRPGDYVLEGRPIFYYKGGDRDKVKKLVLSSFVFGTGRAAISDLELLLDELVAIAMRALSPGINDLATARQAIDGIGNCCNILLNRRLLSGVHGDQDGMKWIYSKEFDFYGFVHTAFDRIRQNSGGQPAVLIHLIEVIERLKANCRASERREILDEIVEQIAGSCQGVTASTDQEKLQELVDRVIA